MKNLKTYKSSWYEFTPTWSGFALVYDVAGYFNSKPILQIYFIWGKLFLYMPWKHYKKTKIKYTDKELRYNKLKKISNKNYKQKIKYKYELYDEVNPPSYGIYYYMNQIGIKYGYKVKLFDMPWSFYWIRTSVLTKEYKWIHETKKNKNMDFWNKNKWKDIILYKSYPYIYTDKYNNTQNCIATYYIVEREWRLKYFKWFKPIRKVIRDIEVEFSSDDNNIFKGECKSCSYKILKGEHDKETLLRMEKEKKF